MFNDLNPAQNNRQPVDDIFAETDKPNNNPPGSIETHRVGLTSVNEGAPVIAADQAMPKSKVPWFKISAGVIILAILVLSGYLVYSKFFQPSTDVIAEKTAEKNPVTNTVTENNNTVIPATNDQASNTPVFVSEIPGLSSTTASTTSTSSEISTSTAISTIDTDNDGLTDEEEKTAGTDPTKVDTDNDGLSDYDEVKIYRTNPLLADTDGDTFKDGDEVKSGYNPNGAGKMPGLTSANSASASTSSPAVVK